MSRLIRSDRKNLPHRKLDLEFDFTIAERPKYIPGSGPPLAPILAMPPRDKDGYIIKEVMLYSELRYLVGYEELPHLRVSVKLGNILNWVSPWALEEYHANKYEREEKEREEAELPLIEAKEERRRKRMEKTSRGDLQEVAQSRKRKRTPIDEVPFKGKKSATPNSGKRGRLPGPGHRYLPVVEEVTVTSPRQSKHSQQQPSLSAGGLANRTVLDTDSDDEDSMPTDVALHFQLKGGRLLPSNVPNSGSGSTSKPSSMRDTGPRSASKPISVSHRDNPLVSAPNGTRHRSHQMPASILPTKSAVATASSRKAPKVNEDLERKNDKPQTIVDKYSYLRKESQAHTFKHAHVGLAGRARGLGQVATGDEETDEPNEEDEEEAAEEGEQEYEIKCILDDEIRMSENGVEEIWYKIKWVGEWEDTWEPEENIGNDAIQEYRDEKRMRKGKGRLGLSARNGEEESDPDSLFVSDRNGKGKKAQRGQVIDDDDDDDSEDYEVQEVPRARD